MKMQKQRLILPIIAILVMTLAIVPIVSAATYSTLVGVAEGTNYSTTMPVFNCTTRNDSDDCHTCTNATIFYNASGGATTGTAGSVLCELINITDDLFGHEEFLSTSNAACAAAWAALTEADNTPGYNFSCVFSNSSATYARNGTAVGTVGIDRTAPTVTMSTDYSSVYLGRYFKYTIAIADATTGLLISYCNITDAEGEVDKDGAISTSATKTDFTHTDVAGNYNITCVAVDYSGNADNDSVQVTAKTTGAPIVSGGEGVGFLDRFSRNQIIIGIIGIVVLVWLITKKK